MKKTIIITTLLTLSPFSWSADYTGPSKPTTVAENQEVFNRYCIGTADSDSVPKVNYENEKVKRAAKKLSAVSAFSYYFYSGPLKAYGLKSAPADTEVVPAPAPEKYADDSATGAPSGTSHNAHNFLVILCGEFRDQASMIEAKLDWVTNLYKLPDSKQGKIDLSKNLWAQVSAHSYSPYLYFSQSLWGARQEKYSKQIKLGDYEVDSPVEGQLVCETKFIFDQYITKDKPFDNLSNFESEYKKFEAVEGNCSLSDKDSYYDFRGDSNFKPNSPESNGMIWYSSSITNQCKSTTEAKEGAKIKSSDCSKYFKAPFKARWNAARAGLSAWLFRDKKFDSTFSSEGSAVYIIPHQLGSSKPFEFKINGQQYKEFISGWSQPTSWPKSDIGYNELFALGTSKPDYKTAYERIRDAVNRHTDWYSSGFDDGMGMLREQAYSPFVASSYEMSASNGFTSPGVTVKSASDGKKHWMFVFRVKKQNWYNTASLAENKLIDFDKHWFDETSLGTNGLAKSEHAWDRLGTPLEDEMDSIIYLHNITTGEEVVADGFPNINEM